MKNKKQTYEIKWKSIAIIFIILFVLETSLFVWAYSLSVKEEKMIMECYYDICEDYPDAYFEENLCSCIGYDLWGEEIVSKQEYMG